MYALAPSPEPETVIGNATEHNTSNPSSSWKMCERIALRNVSFTIALNAVIINTFVHGVVIGFSINHQVWRQQLSMLRHLP